MRRAEQEHEKTAVAAVEEAIPDVQVSDDLAKSVLRNAIENVESLIDVEDSIVKSLIVEGNVPLDTPVTFRWERIREFNGLEAMGDLNIENFTRRLLTFAY